MTCSKCHETLERLMIFAMLVDVCGARMTPSPEKCSDGKPHSFPVVQAMFAKAAS